MREVDGRRMRTRVRGLAAIRRRLLGGARKEPSANEEGSGYTREASRASENFKSANEDLNGYRRPEKTSANEEVSGYTRREVETCAR